MKIISRNFFLIITVLTASAGFGQSGGLRILDDKTGDPVPFAHVKATLAGSNQSHYYVSDVNGETGLKPATETEIKITYIGYETFSGMIEPGESPVVRLKPSVTTFDETVVTAQYTPVSADRSLYRINVINSMQIQKKAANDLSGLLRNQLNVRISQDAALGAGMSIQGLSGENVKILVDGVPVIGRMNGIIDLAQLTVQNVQQVEIIEGPMSVIYGSNALAGVVNIITKANDGHRFSANGESYIESVGVYNFDGGINLNRGKQGLTLHAGRNFFSGFQGKYTGRELEWKPRRQLNLDAGYTLNLKKMNLSSHFNFFDELMIGKGALAQPYFYQAFDYKYHTDRYTASANMETKGCNHFTANASYSFYNRARTKYFNDLSIPEMKAVESDTSFVGAVMSRGMYTYRGTSGKLGFQTGYDINHEWAGGDRIGGSHRQISDVAAFLSMQYQPLEFISIQPGMRLAYNSQYKSPLIYALHTRFTPYKGATLRASFSSGFRSPSIKELYMYFYDSNHDIIGNPDLMPEESKHVQLQFVHRIEGTDYATEAELNVFYNDIRNNITLARVGVSTLKYSYINIDSYTTKGFSAGFRTTLYPAFDMKLGLGYTGTHRNFANASADTSFLWSPEFTTEVTYKFLKNNISLSVFYKYTGKLPQFNVDESQNVTQGIIEDYHNLDLSIIKSLLKGKLLVSAGGKNLFNVTSITSTGNGSGSVHSGGSDVPVSWGRTVFVKLNFNITYDDKKPAAK